MKEGIWVRRNLKSTALSTHAAWIELPLVFRRSLFLKLGLGNIQVQSFLFVAN